jgi:hypothetical protein
VAGRSLIHFFRLNSRGEQGEEMTQAAWTIFMAFYRLGGDGAALLPMPPPKSLISVEKDIPGYSPR